MNFKEINSIRKSGNIEKAYDMAQEAIHMASEASTTPTTETNNKENDDLLWSKRAMGWVLFDMLKQAADKCDIDGFKKNLQEFLELNFSKTEKVLYNQVYLQLGRMVFAIQNDDLEERSTEDLIYFIEQAKKIPAEKPSWFHSYFLKACFKARRNYPDFHAFMQWWDVTNLREEDFETEHYKGQTFSPLAERVYKYFAEYYLKQLANEIDNQSAEYKEIIEFMKALDVILLKHPQFYELLYFKLKMMLAIGNINEETKVQAIAFIKEKHDEFWAWDILSDYLDDEELKISALCRACTVNVPEHFLFQVHLKLAKLFVQRKMYFEAWSESQKIIHTALSNDWHIPKMLKDWSTMDWYKKIQTGENPSELRPSNSYYSAKALIEDYVFNDIAEKTVLIDQYNAKRKMFHFFIDDAHHGYFKIDKECHFI